MQARNDGANGPERRGSRWALVLGASSGIGAGIAGSLASDGYNVIGIHLDLSERFEQIDRFRLELEGSGVRAVFLNANAASESAQRDVVARCAELAQHEGISVFVHSLAFGVLAPFIRTAPDVPIVLRRQMDTTFTVMAHTLVYWTQALFEAGLLRAGAKVFAMTSAGSTKVTAGYGAVSAAKAALESHVRQLALELAPHGIGVNAIRAGVTDTPALRKIPGADRIVARALEGNPFRRLTTPGDVGALIVSLANHPGTWVTGNTIGVDGGELNVS